MMTVILFQRSAFNSILGRAPGREGTDLLERPRSVGNSPVLDNLSILKAADKKFWIRFISFF
jgi:hypothetical protein